MTREWKFFIQDIYDAIQYVKEFIGSMKRKEFLADEKTRSAVAFKIENIGEASKNIPKEIKAQYKELPWTDKLPFTSEKGLPIDKQCLQLAIEELRSRLLFMFWKNKRACSRKPLNLLASPAGFEPALPP